MSANNVGQFNELMGELISAVREELGVASLTLQR